MKNKYIIVLVTAKDKKQAKSIAQALLQDKLVACVNVMDAIESMYWWQGKIESSKECLMILKTTQSLFSKVEKIVKEKHSYDTPEIIALDITNGSKSYLNWIDQSITTKRK